MLGMVETAPLIVCMERGGDRCMVEIETAPPLCMERGGAGYTVETAPPVVCMERGGAEH